MAIQAIQYEDLNKDAFFERSPFALVVCDADWKITKANDAFRKMIGDCDHYLAATHSDDIAYEKRLIDFLRVSPAGRQRSGPYRKRFLAGGENSISVNVLSAEVVKEEGKELLRFIIIEGTQKEFEQVDGPTYAKLPMGIALCDIHGTLIEMNQAYLDIIGYTEEEARNKSYWEFTPPKYETDEKKQLVSLTEHGHYGPYEKHYIHKDGHLVPVCLFGWMTGNEGDEQLIFSVIERRDEEKLINEVVIEGVVDEFHDNEATVILDDRGVDESRLISSDVLRRSRIEHEGQSFRLHVAEVESESRYITKTWFEPVGDPSLVNVASKGSSHGNS